MKRTASKEKSSKAPREGGIIRHDFYKGIRERLKTGRAGWRKGLPKEISQTLRNRINQPTEGREHERSKPISDLISALSKELVKAGGTHFTVAELEADLNEPSAKPRTPVAAIDAYIGTLQEQVRHVGEDQLAMREALLPLARALERERRWTEVIRVLTSLVDLEEGPLQDPIEGARSRISLAKAYINRRDFESAKAVLQKAEEALSQSLPNGSSSKTRLEVLLQMARVCTHNSNYEAAEKILRLKCRPLLVKLRKGGPTRFPLLEASLETLSGIAARGKKRPDLKAAQGCLVSGALLREALGAQNELAHALRHLGNLHCRLAQQTAVDPPTRLAESIRAVLILTLCTKLCGANMDHEFVGFCHLDCAKAFSTLSEHCKIPPGHEPGWLRELEIKPAIRFNEPESGLVSNLVRRYFQAGLWPRTSSFKEHIENHVVEARQLAAESESGGESLTQAIEDWHAWLKKQASKASRLK